MSLDCDSATGHVINEITEQAANSEAGKSEDTSLSRDAVVNMEENCDEHALALEQDRRDAYSLLSTFEKDGGNYGADLQVQLATMLDSTLKIISKYGLSYDPNEDKDSVRSILTRHYLQKFFIMLTPQQLAALVDTYEDIFRGHFGYSMVAAWMYRYCDHPGLPFYVGRYMDLGKYFRDMATEIGVMEGNVEVTVRRGRVSLATFLIDVWTAAEGKVNGGKDRSGNSDARFKFYDHTLYIGRALDQAQKWLDAIPVEVPSTLTSSETVSDGTEIRKTTCSLEESSVISPELTVVVRKAGQTISTQKLFKNSSFSPDPQISASRFKLVIKPKSKLNMMAKLTKDINFRYFTATLLVALCLCGFFHLLCSSRHFGCTVFWLSRLT